MICLLILNSQIFSWRVLYESDQSSMPVEASNSICQGLCKWLWRPLLSGMEAQQWDSHIMVNILAAIMLNSGHVCTSVICYPLETPQPKI